MYNLQMLEQRVGRYKPDAPLVRLPLVAQRALDHLDHVRDGLIDRGFDLRERPSDLLTGALLNKGLVDLDIAPGLTTFFNRTADHSMQSGVSVAFESRGTILLSYLDLTPGGPIYFCGYRQRLEHNLGELTEVEIQRLSEVQWGRRAVSDFGNLTPDRLIGKFASRIRKYTR